MRPSLKLLAALLQKDEWSSLDELSADGVEVSTCHRRELLRATLQSLRPDVLLLPVADERGVPVTPLLGHAHGHAGRVAVFVRRADARAPHQLPLIGRGGADLFLFEDSGPLLSLVREHFLTGTDVGTGAAALLARMDLVATAELAPLVAALEQPESWPRPADVASSLGISHRSLNRWAARAGIVTARDLCALAALTHHTATLEIEGYPSWRSARDVQSIHRALLRVTGMPWTAFIAASPARRWQQLRAALFRPVRGRR